MTRVIVREGKLNRKTVKPLSLTELMKDIDLDQWDNDRKFKRYHSDSKSFDQDEGEHVTDENVVDLFQHEKDQVNEDELKCLIEEKSINKFKRKVSPPVGIPGSKSRRSSVDQSASPSLRDRERISLMEYEGRLRSNTVSGTPVDGKKKNVAGKKIRRRCSSTTEPGPRQRLLTNMWDMIKKKAVEMEDQEDGKPTPGRN